MIKLKETPINRRYWINSNVIYKIENKKLGDGGAVTNETVGTNGDITYTNSTEKLPVINLYKAGSNQISQTFYLDDFIEIGDMWNISSGDVTKNGDNKDIYNYFIFKCEQEIKALIESKPQLTVDDFENGRYNDVVPSWVLSTNSSFEMYKKGEKSTANKINKISVDTILNNAKKEIVKNEIEKTFNTLKTKYGLPNTTTIVGFVNEAFGSNN